MFLDIIVVPRASRSEVVSFEGGVLKLRIAALPADGEANKELIKLLSKLLKVPRSAIEITSGHRSRRKRVSLEGIDASEVASILSGIS